MSRTRNIIQEIAEVRHRRLFGDSMAELSLRLRALERAFAKYDRDDEELVRYFPVAIIACVEGYFRMAIRDLVDAGEPFLSNAEKVGPSLKIEFELLRAVHGKSVTVGELISHGVQLSRLEHIDSTLSALLGKGLLASLGTVTDRWEHEVMGKPSAPIVAEPDAVFADVARTFELRHIICHEIASAYTITGPEVERCFQSCVLFLRAADELVSETLHPGAPLTQADMNTAAGESLRRANARLEEGLADLRSRADEWSVRALDDAQTHWQAYRDAWANFSAGDPAASGTIWPVIYLSAAEAVVARRIEEVEAFRSLGEQL